VQQLELGFCFNDPYYPRPHSKHGKDVALWSAFRDQYLATSAGLTESALPRLFIEGVEAEGMKCSTGGPLFQ
jgi:hypothetical protein